ncbi:uncharacterized protein LOC106172383 isoform X2 [Lingula anatina]|uniref:Uncharacterized protein LOC106172383 isoform X2 n=1 Tax=Lingula anatina TaxID=7574 RepID=A0A1S3JF45_LINAN|nr:uncharacterized protein LOC106172383 isoform X2 [Lingula anatina]|eukprot:XP_013408514.1 uncharacterized protein LOC106172383 isoform X2 [Lingula anatina]
MYNEKTPAHLGECYHLLDHNCNTFSNEIAQFLTGNSIPSKITSLPADVLSTPFGAMIRPFIDAMSVSPGGHSVFPQQTQGASPAAATSQPSSAKKEVEKTPKAASEKSKSSAEDYDLLPVVYKESKVLNGSRWQTVLEDRVTKHELDTINEVHEFLSASNPQWALGRNHMDALCKIINKEEVPEEVHVMMYQLLQLAVLNEEFVNMMAHYNNHPMMKLASSHEGMSKQILSEVGKLLTNCSSTRNGSSYILSTEHHPLGSPLSNCKITSQTCAACLLHEDRDIQGVGAALASNLAKHSIPEDVAVEVGSALLQCLLTDDTSDDFAYQALVSLYRFTLITQEVADLCAVMGLDLQKYKKSDKLSNICNQLQLRISS